MTKEGPRFVSWAESNRAQWAHYRLLTVITSILFLIAVVLMIGKPVTLAILLVVVYLGGGYLLGARYVRKQESEQLPVEGPKQ